MNTVPAELVYMLVSIGSLQLATFIVIMFDSKGR